MQSQSTDITKRAILNSPTVWSAFGKTASTFADRVAVRTAQGDCQVTWREFEHHVRRIAAGMQDRGVGAGDTVGLFLSNRPEFHLLDVAAMSLAAVPFSLYPTLAPEQLVYILNHAATRIVITEPALLPALEAARPDCPALEHIVVIESVEQLAQLHGDPNSAASNREPRPDDLATLIYTSGTTGTPKGVEVTHANLMAGLRAMDELLTIPQDAEFVSYLPMAHIAERLCTHYLPIACGATVTACPDPREVLSYVKDVRPHWFFAPPRMWEKLKAALEAGIAADPDAERKARTESALQRALERLRTRAGSVSDESSDLKDEDGSDQPLSNLLRSLGLERTRVALVGAAPCPPEVVEFFCALGLPMVEAWGLSECTAFGACNPPGRIRPGTVGPAIPSVELRLADDGEVLVRSPMVMRGYRNAPAETAEALDDEGWLHTGDIGQLDADGYLRIVDRKKEIIVNSSGKSMSPVAIESRLKSAGRLIGQACVVGDRRPYVVALLTLDPDSGADPHDKSLIAQVQSEVDEANRRLSRVEQVKKFHLLRDDWQPGGDELTPTMKLRRKAIHTKYADILEELYA